MPQKVHFFPPPLLCKSKLSMCQQLRETGRGVDDVHCCAIHIRGVLKPRNRLSLQSVHHFIGGHQDEQLNSRLCCLLVVVAASYFRYFQIKSPPAKNPVLNSNGVQCKSLISKTNLTCITVHAKLCASQQVTCLHLPQWRPSGGFLEKREYYTSLLDRQGGTLHCLPCC